MSLFPEMDREISDERKAARRENVQRARHYLSKRNLSWLINHLLEHGPKTEHILMLNAMEAATRFEDAPIAGRDVLFDLIALWYIRKLWRRKMGIHQGSGEESFLYGIRGVHTKPPPPKMTPPLNVYL